MKVSYTYEANIYTRYSIAYWFDVVRGPKSKAEWNETPRLATRQEVYKFLSGAVDNENLEMGDEVPNLNKDGTIVRRLFEVDEEDDENA